MENLTKAIFDKMPRSTMAGLIGSRLYEDAAPQKTQYPYVVYSIISSPKERTFTEIFRNTLIQFAIYSASTSTAEVKAIYAALSALYDEKDLTITGSKLVWMREENLLCTEEEHTTPTGVINVKAWFVDFEAKTSLN